MKDDYIAILKSGMLWVWFPTFAGNWEDDMVDFIEYCVTKCAI